MNKVKFKNYFLLHLLLFFFSFCSIFSKLASSQKVFSFKFILYYSISLFILGLYTILWQQILKKVPLINAFLNKSIIIIWSMIWGCIIFSETITLKMIIGGFIVLIGVSLVVTEKNE